MSRIAKYYKIAQEACELEYPVKNVTINVPRHSTLVEWVRLALVGYNGCKLIETSALVPTYGANFRLTSEPFDAVLTRISGHLGAKGRGAAEAYATYFVNKWLKRRNEEAVFDVTSLFEKAGPYRGVLAKLIAQRVLRHVSMISEAVVAGDCMNLPSPLDEIARCVL